MKKLLTWGVFVLVLVFLTSCMNDPTGYHSFDITDSNQSGCFRASAIPVTPGETIFLNGTVNFTGLGDCIFLDVANVTLDCLNNSIIGTPQGEIAITVESDNITIKNCIIRNLSGVNGTGIFAENVDQLMINHSAIGPMGDARIVVSNVSNLTINNSRFTENATLNTTLVAESLNDFTIQNCIIGDTLDIRTSSNGEIMGNTFLDVDNSPLAASAVDLLLVTSGVSIDVYNNLNVPTGFRFIESAFIDVRDNTFVNNGRVSVNGNNNVVRRNIFTPTIEKGASGGIELLGQGNILNNHMSNGISLTISLVNAVNSTMENNVVENITGRAYSVEYSTNITVRNNTARNITGIGFDNIDSDQVKYDNNTLIFVNKITNSVVGLFLPGLPSTPEAGYAFRVSDSDFVRIENGTINLIPLAGSSVEDSGIVGENLRFITIHNNTISNVRDGVHLINSTDGNISNNSFTGLTHKVILLDGGYGNQINGNTITNPTGSLDVFFNKRGIELLRNTLTKVESNTISGYKTGIHLHNSTLATINHNTINSFTHGLFSLMSEDNDVYNLTVTGSKVGVKLVKTNDTEINMSTITASLRGFELYESHKNNITNTTFTSNTNSVSHMSSNNTLDGNTFVSAGTFDIIFDLFASNNNGVSNTIPKSTVDKNFATGNIII